ncbi:MAG: hypothetical protein IPL46_15480 [Saprospiraceae bacterium]|nr:hypothetical protein [Saprospiraceae bacterium]
MRFFFVNIISLLTCIVLFAQDLPEEDSGYLMVEAESFESQILDDIRKWYVINSESAEDIQQAESEDFYKTASGEAYTMVLPDTRKTHDDLLIAGENFSNEPGRLALLNYRVKFNNPGKYFVWVRTLSTGTEDNGVQVGIDGVWHESGQRMQWCDGKNQWTWASKQRTQEEHCGVEELIYLEVDKPGEHIISFSMREDGFRFDKWVMSADYKKPE